MKKKLKQDYPELIRIVRKGFLIMRLFLFLMILGVLHSTASVSQTKRFNLNEKNISFKEVLKLIEEQSEFRFFYEEDNLKTEDRFNIDSNNSTIEEVLSQLFDQTGIEYKVLNNNFIVLKPKPEIYSNQINGLQKDKTIIGKVTNSSGDPLPGATVVIKGSTNGTITDYNGNYSIFNVTDDAILVFSFVGMKVKEVYASGKDRIDVTLEEEMVGVGEVVVTALGIKKEKKALGYSVQEVKTEDLNKTGDTQVTSALQGKVAGLLINESGSGLGGSTKVTIRGYSSLSGNNEPLWVVDGIPFSNEGGGGGSQWGDLDRAGKIFDLNPEDIETISVLKGANAAALYGSRAGNGVILITTKRGKINQQRLGINYDFNYTISKPSYFLKIQKKYGQGDYNVYNSTAQSAWGPEFDGTTKTAFNGESREYTSKGNLLKDFLRSGITSTHNLSVEGGSEKGSFSASIGNSNMNGLYEDYCINKKNTSLAATYDVNKHINIDGKVSVFYNETKNQRGTGNYSIPTYFYQMPSNINLSDLSPGYVINEDGDHVEYNYTAINAAYRNPYFIMSQLENKMERYRLFGYLSLNVSFTDYLKLRIKHGTDLYRESSYYKTKYADASNTNTPSMNMSEALNEEDNTEALFLFNKQVNDFSLNANLGANRMYRKSDYYYQTSGKIDSEDAVYLSAGTNTTGDYSFQEKEIQSVYGSGEIGYKGFAFFNFTGRNDWSSTLPKNNRSYFYPSFSLTGLITDALTQYGAEYNKNVISFVKIRTSWAQVGKDTDPYHFTKAYILFDGPNGLLNAQPISTTKINSNLKPEITTSKELGADIRFFDNRLGLDITYYQSSTRNQIIRLETSHASGYDSEEVNAGKITNNGLEIMINTIPVKREKLTISAAFNFAANKSEVVSLSSSLKESLLGDMYGIGVLALEGEKFGQIRGTAYRRDANNNLVVDSNGAPLYDESKIIGNIQPDWTGSFSLNVDFRRFFCSALINVKQGGDIISISEMIATRAGTSLQTGDRADQVVKGVVADENGSATSTVNTTSIDAQTYWTTLANINEAFVYDASYIKLQEFAIGYNIPNSALNRLIHGNLHRVRFSLTGRNLFYFKKHTPGTTPDGSGLTNTAAADAWDFSPVPGAKTYGFNLRVEF